MQKRLSDFIKKEFCITDLKAKTKEEAIREMVSAFMPSGKVRDKERFILDLLGREEMGPTSPGKKVAIPRSPSDAVESLIVGFGRSKAGIDFNSPDHEKINLIFLVGTNAGDLNIYLVILGKLTMLLQQEFFRKELLAANSPSEIIGIIKRFEIR